MILQQELLFDGPAEAPFTIVLAHGAGAPMDSPFMNDVAERLACSEARVVRFEFPYMHERRTAGKRRAPDHNSVLERRWLEVLEHLGDAQQLWIGGKSMGGRIASMIADQAQVAGLVCLGYPFHPPGRTDRPRIEHLRRLKTPALFVQGTRDPFGSPGEIAGYDLSPSIAVVYIEGGDHSLAARARSGQSTSDNLQQAVDAILSFVQKSA